MFWKFLVLLLVVAASVVRFNIVPGPLDLSWPTVYKDFAHILVGLLAGLAIGCRSWFYTLLFVAICVVEVVAFKQAH